MASFAQSETFEVFGDGEKLIIKQGVNEPFLFIIENPIIENLQVSQRPHMTYGQFSIEGCMRQYSAVSGEEVAQKEIQVFDKFTESYYERRVKKNE